MENKPNGFVTFLFTDIEGSTKLSQEFPDTLQCALDIHHRILTEAIQSNNGFVFEIIGDAFCATFENADDAVKAAVEAQTRLSKEKWTDAVIKARMGLHSGSAEWNGKRYMGYITLARTARVMSAAFGEQIIISNDTYEKLSVVENSKINFRDLGERRLKDIIKPIKLFQVISPGLREDFPPLKTLDVRPNNLPVQLTSFIGREDEIRHAKKLLNRTHLLTLVGSGGAGKTRFSLQIGAEVIDDFANGVWFIELASISDPLLLVQAVMSALGVLEEPKNTPIETLTGFLKDKEILIILDNCEHMINASAGLAENLLSKCPNLKILVTSREALKCEGEQIYRIPSLSQPDPETKVTPEELTKYESVRLFIERALAVNFEFIVTNENAPALAEICSRLDGIPLAIELAAARTKILTVEKIYERLDDRFSLLTGGKRTALPRQQTLRSLIDWSYDLLSENEKKLWSRLSVFRGGWTLESSEEICSDEIPDKFEIVELLQNLSEKSIIIFDSVIERYRMLETIRQYGDEKLKITKEYKTITEKHLKYYTELAETADIKLQGPDIVIWLKTLDEEKGNMEKGLMYSDEIGDMFTEARLAGALGYYWDIRGQITEGILRFELICLNIPETKNPTYIKIIFLNGLLTHRNGKIEKATKYLRESHDQYVKLNNKPGIGSALKSLGDIFRDKGEYDKAAEMFKESLEIRRNIEDKRGIADSLNGLGNVSFDKGEYAKAADLYEESLEIRRVIGDKRGIANSLHWLGNISNYKGEHNKATSYYGESLAIRRDIGDIRGIASSLNNLGNVYIVKEEYENAADLYEESLATFRCIGDKRGIADSLNGLGNVSFDKSDYDKAGCFYEESLTIKYEMGEKRGIANSLNNLGNVFYHKGEYDKAAGYYEDSLGIKRDIGDKRGIANSLNGLGNVSYFKGDYDKANGFYKEGLKISREIDYKMAIEDSLKNLGAVSLKKGEYDKAQKYFQEILSHNIVLGNKKKITDFLLRIIDLCLKKKSGVSIIKLLGFLNHFSKSNKIIFEKPEQKVFDESVSKLKEDIGEEEFLRSFEKGKSMTLEESVDLILNIKL